jgi:hypothetical protein
VAADAYAYPRGARRGRVALDEKTHRERVAEVVEARPLPELSESDRSRFF